MFMDMFWYVVYAVMGLFGSVYGILYVMGYFIEKEVMFTHVFVINTSVKRVYDVLRDFPNWPDWNKDVTKMTPHMGAAGVITWEQQYKGGEFCMVQEIETEDQKFLRLKLSEEVAGLEGDQQFTFKDVFRDKSGDEYTQVACTEVKLTMTAVVKKPVYRVILKLFGTFGAYEKRAMKYLQVYFNSQRQSAAETNQKWVFDTGI
eukprot:GFYU01011317.1.p1 GENE.GFYU01011317.1~~GFYU01011317.1.p1  ORF type:complete len:217 (-),score=58.94 GFYU01011317.1:41-649(-)